MPVIQRLRSHKRSVLDKDAECNSRCMIFMMLDILSGDLRKSSPGHFALEKKFSLKLFPINYLW